LMAAAERPRRRHRPAARDTGGVASKEDADHSTPSTGDDLEELASAAYLLGDADECRRALQRAQRAYLEGGNRRRAARCLFWVGRCVRWALWRGGA
jgi:hypothetical protein